MNALGREIAGLIAADGPIGIDRYMALALGHPEHGYYRRREPFGATGDFITAPDISQMFGELIGLWAADVWAGMGAPPRILLVECGPGRGTLLADALRAARAMPPFLAALEVHCVETSPRLRAAQEEALRPSGKTVTWHTDIASLPDGPCIVVANEFFDALPVRHYVRARDGWHERLIGLDADGGLTFGLAPGADAAVTLPAHEGAVLELGIAAYALMRALAHRLAAQGGAALVIDYGHTDQAFGETLQALRAHAFAPVLAAPGDADLTAHVDFAALSRAARGAGLRVSGPVTQGAFLETLGITARAGALKARASAEAAAGIDAAVQRLCGRDAPGMGSLFKVLAVSAMHQPAPIGFAAREGVPQ